MKKRTHIQIEIDTKKKLEAIRDKYKLVSISASIDKLLDTCSKKLEA